MIIFFPQDVANRPIDGFVTCTEVPLTDEVLIVVLLTARVVWRVTPCRLVNMLEGRALFLYCMTLKMKARRCFEKRRYLIHSWKGIYCRKIESC